MEQKRLNQNSQLDLQEVMKKVVSLENKLVLQAQEIELQSNEIKSLKQMLSKNINTHQQSIYRHPARGQENLQQHHHNHNVVIQQPHSGTPLRATGQPRRYSREFLNNVRYSTGASNYSSYTMNPMVHPPTAIPPINVPSPTAGIINILPPTSTTITNNNSNSKSDANQNSFKLKPSKLHVTSTSLQPSLPVTSNGRFEPSISVNGFRYDEGGDADLSSRKHDAAVHHRQGFVENPHNNATNNAASTTNEPDTSPKPASSFFWKPRVVTNKRHQPKTKPIGTKVLEPEQLNMQCVSSEKQVRANHGADSETSDAVDKISKRLDLKPRENDNPCRCPILYSISRRRKVGTASNLNDEDDSSIDELTSEEQEEQEPLDGQLYLRNPRAEKARLIIPKRDEKTLNYHFKFINKADELEENEIKETPNDLAKSCLNIDYWSSPKSTSAAQFVSSTSPKKKALKLDLSSKFTIQDFISKPTLS